MKALLALQDYALEEAGAGIEDDQRV